MNTQRSQERAQNRLERKYRRPTYNALQNQVQEAIQRLGQVRTQGEAESLATLIQPEGIQETLTEAYKDTYKVFTEGTYEAIRKQAQKSKKEDTSIEVVSAGVVIPPVSDALVDDWLRKALKFVAINSGVKAQMITETSKALFERAIKFATAEALAQGLSVFEARKRLQSYTREYMGKQNRYRAVRVIRTEVGMAASDASFEAAKSTGLNLKKKWVFTNDNRTRDSHMNVNPSVIGLYENFDVNGEKMDKPRMVGAEPSEVINCRCAMVYITPNDPEFNQSI